MGKPMLAQPTTRFRRPDDLQAAEPPEARGLERDGVRLLTATPEGIRHGHFRDLGAALRPGDLLVVNTSATRPAAIDGTARGLGPVVVHVSGRHPGGPATDEGEAGDWVVELRTAPTASTPIRHARAGTRVGLAGGVTLTLIGPAGEPAAGEPAGGAPVRLWRARPRGPVTLGALLREHGRPIRYGYLNHSWPLTSYQTVFADPGGADGRGRASAEMPSAGRPFSTALVTRLVSAGVRFAPVALHCGVSSLESGEPPYPEWFAVPEPTADLVNHTHEREGRVVAVGTTVTRALESVADADGVVKPGHGWTDLVLGPERPARTVDGLVTGLHDPDASHLLLLEAVAGPERVQQVYDAAVDRRYLWHEFGDACLLLTPPR